MSCSSCYGCTNCYPCTTCGAAAPPPPPPPDCPNPVQCEEVINSKCVVYDGVDLPNLGVLPSEDGPITVNDIFYYIDQSIYNAGIGTVNITSNSDCLTVSGSGTAGNPIVLDLNLGTGLTCGDGGIQIDSTALQNIDVEQYSGQAWTDSATKIKLTTNYDTKQTGTSVALLTAGGGTVAPLSATEWKQKTLVQALDYILFPSRDASYDSPEIGLTITKSVVKGMTPTTAYFEAGSKLQISFKPTASNKDAGGLYKLQIFNSPGTQLGSNQIPPSFATTGPSVLSDAIKTPYAMYKPDGTDTASTDPNYNKIVRYSYEGTAYIPDNISGETGVNLILPKPSTVSGLLQQTADISWFTKAFFKDGPIKKNINADTYNTADQIKDVTTGRSSSPTTYTCVYPTYYGIVNGSSASDGLTPAQATLGYFAARVKECSSDAGTFGTLSSTSGTPIRTKKQLINADGNVSINYALTFNSSTTISNYWHWIAIPRAFALKNKSFNEWISSTNASDIVTVGASGAQSWVLLGEINIDQADSNPLWANVPYRIYRTTESTNTGNGNTTFKNS